MNHCPNYRAGKRPCCPDEQRMQAVAQAKPIVLCPAGCGQYATSHQPGDKWCGRRG